MASGQLRRELRELLRAPTIARWLNLCDLPVTSSCALWQAVHAVDQKFPDHPPRGVAGNGEPWDRVPDGFTFARALHWARKQRLMDPREMNGRRPH